MDSLIMGSELKAATHILVLSHTSGVGSVQQEGGPLL